MGEKQGPMGGKTLITSTGPWGWVSRTGPHGNVTNTYLISGPNDSSPVGRGGLFPSHRLRFVFPHWRDRGPLKRQRSLVRSGPVPEGKGEGVEGEISKRRGMEMAVVGSWVFTG